MEKTRELRKFGLSFTLGMAILTTVALWQGWSPWFWGVSSGLGIFHAGAAWLIPRALAPTHFVARVLGQIVGTVLTAVVFTLFYYLIFCPIALILRAAGKDQIRPHGKLSVWESVPEAENDPRRIEKLY